MTVSFLLSPEQEQLKAAVRGFAEEHLRRLAAAVRTEPDPLRRALLARPVFEKAVGHGFLKGLIPAPFGGAAGRRGRGGDLHRGVGLHSPDFMISMAGPLIALAPVYEAGTPEQIRRFVAPFLADPARRWPRWPSASPRAAPTSTRPAGAGLRTTAVPDGDEYVINGRKAWASHLSGWDGDGPDLMTIVCRTPGGVSLIVAEREHLAGHIEVEEHYDLPGLRGCLTSRVRLHDVRVPRANLLGAEGQGVALTRNAFCPAARRSAFSPSPPCGGHSTIGLSLRDHRDPRRRRADHRAPGGGRRPRGRQGQDRGGPAPGLACARCRDVAGPRGPRAGPARQGLRLRDGRRGHQRRSSWSACRPTTQRPADVEYLSEALAYPVIEGSNIGIRRRQLQDLLRTPGYDPLGASGMV